LFHLLALCNNNQINPFSIRGSAAGAFGLCQFVPSSYLAYGTDGNGDGVVDLFDFSDAMASTANFLKSHGWHNRNAGKQFRAILAYNHCEHYAKAVLTYSKQVKLCHNKKTNTAKKNIQHQKNGRCNKFARI
jgi:membrane-bound lytic murein transglycosylase B